MSELPNGWAQARLGEIADLVSGAGFPLNMQNRKGLPYPFFKVGNLGDVDARTPLTTSDHSVDDKMVAMLKARVLPSGTIVFAKIGMAIRLNRRRQLGLSACIDNNMMAAVARPVVAPRFLLRFLETVDLMPLTQSTTVPSLRKSDLDAITVPLPPLAEQRRIIEKVESLLEQVGLAQARLERGAVIVRRFRQAVLAAACSGELTKAWRECKGSASHQDVEKRAAPSNELPDFVEHLEGEDFPADWSRVRVDALVTIQNGRAFPSKEYLERGGVRLLRPGNLHVNGTVEWDAGNTVSLAKKWARDYPEFVLGSGELLMNLTAQSLRDEFLGRVCIKTDAEPALLNQRIARLSPVTVYDVRRYLLLYFKSRFFRSFVNGLDTGSLIRHMHSKDVARHVLPLPSPDEQAEIVRQVGSHMALAEAVERRLVVATARTEKLPQAILSKAFSGELVPQDPNDEPALAVLARLREMEENMKTRKRPARKRMQEPAVSGGKAKTRDLIELVGTSKRGISPEDLFERLGYRPDAPDDIARFYQTLRDAVNEGLLREERTRDGDARLVARP